MRRPRGKGLRAIQEREPGDDRIREPTRTEQLRVGCAPRVGQPARDEGERVADCKRTDGQQPRGICGDIPRTGERRSKPEHRKAEGSECADRKAGDRKPDVRGSARLQVADGVREWAVPRSLPRFGDDPTRGEDHLRGDTDHSPRERVTAGLAGAMATDLREGSGIGHGSSWHSFLGRKLHEYSNYMLVD